MEQTAIDALAFAAEVREARVPDDPRAASVMAEAHVAAILAVTARLRSLQKSYERRNRP